MNKRALITGITGQDGSYMAELLLEKGYEVIGIVRKGEKLRNIAGIKEKIILVEGELTDLEFPKELIQKYSPSEIYNFAGVSSVFHPWEDFKTVFVLNAMMPIAFLEAIVSLSPTIKFFQASSAEMFDKNVSGMKSEDSVLMPSNPYGMAKLLVHEMIRKLREEKNIFVVSGILFNHESERRGENFITRKISMEVSKIHLGKSEVIEMGNLDALRDWGYAKEYVNGMWMSLQAERSDDYVFATGELHSVREFVEEAFKVLGSIISWEGSGEKEIGKNETGKIVVKVNPQFYRQEKQSCCGNIEKIRKVIGWEPKTKFKELVELMVKADYNKLINN